PSPIPHPGLSMSSIRPFLWYATEAEDAANFYVSIIPNSRVVNVMRGGPGGPVIAVDFELDGRPFAALNGRQGPGFTEATSFAVTCETQAEVDRYWNALTSGGGEEGQCGWLKDRWGVSWQVVPAVLSKLLGDPDPAKAGRVMQAMLPMRRLDIAALERAHAGA
ncbi:MAG TPA: VOC family protein, partial [Gemmatimonadaceae bacterium]|nr:VOC family protein [Gemmatimonadaceae bacterium]